MRTVLQVSTTLPETDQATTTTASGVDQTTTTTTTGDKSAIEKAKDVAEALEDAATKPIESVATAPFDVLNAAAGEMAGSSFGRLADVALLAGKPTEVVLGPLTTTVHMLAGFTAFAAIATTVLFLVLVPRRKLGSRLSYLGASTVKFLLISSLGVTIGVAAVELSGKLTSGAIRLGLPDTINTEGANLYDSALAVVVVPLVEVAFEFQGFFVALLIAFWPLAAALSILKTWKHALPIFTALIAANLVWPPLAAFAIGRAFATLPNVGTAAWWCVGAVMIAPIANAIALSSRSTA